MLRVVARSDAVSSLLNDEKEELDETSEDDFDSVNWEMVSSSSLSLIDSSAVPFSFPSFRLSAGPGSMFDRFKSFK